MGRILLFLLCVAGTAFSQEGITVKSDPIILRPKKNSTPPKIHILEPRATEGGTLIVRSDVISLKGVASSENEIRSLDVNGVATTPNPAGGFTSPVSLYPGLNKIIITARDANGNKAREQLDVIFDAAPPVIEIIEPEEAGVRGIRPLAEEGLILRGRAYDDSGIRKLVVNNATIPLSSDSTFWQRLKLGDSQDSILIVATDNVGRVTEKTIFLRQKIKPQPIDFLTGKSYALIIGIDSYSGMWPRLKNAVRDARAVESLLTQDFQFERVYSLFDRDATREKILGTLEYLVTNLKPDDNLLIYYSGHGVKELPFNRGFWVPVDATERSVTRYISNGDIQLMLDAQSPRHVLLVADACFAGDIIKGNPVMIPFGDNPDYYRKVALRKSRKALTSGGEEPVLDGGKEEHSVFAYYFLSALKNIKGAYFDAGQVFNELRIPVTNNSDQVPEFAPIKNTGDEGGQFIFVRK